MSVAFDAQLLQIGSYRHARDDALFIESLGLRAAWIFDHFLLPTMPTLEAWTLLAALAADTTRVRLGALVTNVAFRNAAILAKQALTLDEISGGRINVAVGAGNSPADHDAIGVDFLDPAGRAERLGEAVEILDRGLRGGTVTVEGRHYRVEDAPFSPSPVQTPRPRLYVAAVGPKSERIAVEHADAVVVLSPRDLELEDSVGVFRRHMKRIDERCAEAGRDPSSLDRLYMPAFANEPIFDSNELAAHFIGSFVDAGATEFVFILRSSSQDDPNDFLGALRIIGREPLERLTADVFPLFA